MYEFESWLASSDVVKVVVLYRVVCALDGMEAALPFKGKREVAVIF